MSGLKLPDRFKTPLRIFGLLILLGGTLWAIRNLDLDWQTLALGPALLNLIVVAPLILFVAAVTLRLSARVLGLEIAFPTAVSTVAHANVAELLPLPGGAIVRGAALVQAGAGVKDSARVVMLTAILTLALTLGFSALAFVALGHPVGWALAGLAFLGAGVSAALLYRKAGPGLLAALIAIRLLTLALSIWALWLSFQALGHMASLLEAAMLSVSAVLGSAASIVPAGLGINEAIAAGLASLIGTSAAAAFLAVALNRVIGLLAGAVLAGVMMLWPPPKPVKM